MAPADLKKRIVLAFVLLGLSLTLFAVSTASWLLQLFEENLQAEIGFVQVDIDAYFQDGTNRVEAQEVEIEEGVYKPGVYLINITSNGATDFFEHFRLYVHVSSSVDTYFRVKIYEQLTLTYINYEDVVTELSILADAYMPFDYATANWYDKRTLDNYIYYRLPVKRIDETTPNQIGLITDYTLQNFSLYSAGYSLQIAFAIEAVQAIGGPQHVWGLATPPWGGAW